MTLIYSSKSCCAHSRDQNPDQFMLTEFISHVLNGLVPRHDDGGLHAFWEREINRAKQSLCLSVVCRPGWHYQQGSDKNNQKCNDHMDFLITSIDLNRRPAVTISGIDKWKRPAALCLPWRGPASPGAGSLHGRRRGAGRPATAGAGWGRRREKREGGENSSMIIFY